MARQRNTGQPRILPGAAAAPGPRTSGKGGHTNQPRLGANPENFQSHKISWHLGIIDYQGPFCFTSIGAERILEVIEKLKGFESMRWSEILGKQHHAIPIASITNDARKRLEELKLDEIEELVSLRFMGKERIFGIRQGAVFRVLWWDPEHAICPSILKYT